MLYGEKFGRWQIIDEDIIDGKIKCRCECGTVRYCSIKNLKRGLSKSCGCIQKEKLIQRNKSHEMSKSILYRRWASMIRRCKSNHHRYGGRGITVCEEWKTFEPFMEWALKNGFSEELELDRKDNDGNYEPSNCRWVTKKENARNRINNHLITINGKTKTVKEWSEETGIAYRTLLTRINKGLQGEELIKPVDKRFSKTK